MSSWKGNQVTADKPIKIHQRKVVLFRENTGTLYVTGLKYAKNTKTTTETHILKVILNISVVDCAWITNGHLYPFISNQFYLSVIMSKYCTFRFKKSGHQGVNPLMLPIYKFLRNQSEMVTFGNLNKFIISISEEVTAQPSPKCQRTQCEAVCVRSVFWPSEGCGKYTLCFFSFLCIQLVSEMVLEWVEWKRDVHFKVTPIVEEKKIISSILYL